MKKVLKILKYIIILIILAAITLVVITMVKGMSPPASSSDMHAKVQKMDLDNSISITGKGVSDHVNYVFADISAPVQEIHVHKGDSVQKGDLICTFDVTDLTAQRDSYVRLLEDFEKYNKMKNENYAKGSAYEKDFIQKQLAQLDHNIRTARDQYNEAVNSEQNYANWSNDVAAEAEQLKSEYETVDAEIESIRAEIENYEQTYPQTDEMPEDAEAEPVPPPPYDMQHYTDLVEHSAKLKDLYALALSKKEFYDSKQTEAHNDASALDATIRSYNAEYAQYKAQESSAGTMSVEMRDDLLEDSKTEDNYKQRIADLNKKIENSQIVAGAAGIVTEIYASVGDYMMENPICQIQDEGKMHFEGYLNPNKSEYVSSDSRIIVSLAVNNYEPLEGTILSIDDYYDADKGGYKINFTFDGIDEMEIYPGFEAAAKIVISQQKDAIVVPYDTIFERDGKFYVKKVVTQQDGYTETEDIEVEKGLETAYYVAVTSDKLNADDIVTVVTQAE